MLRLAIVASCLLYASACRLRSREVPDFTWVAMAYGAVPLAVYEAYRGLIPLEVWATSIACTSYAGLLLYLFRLSGMANVCDAADVKALIGLGLTMPTYPLKPLIEPMHPVASIACLDNALLASLLIPLYCIARNLAYKARRGRLFDGPSWSLSEKAGALIMGYKRRLRRLAEGSTLYIACRAGGERVRVGVCGLREVEREGWVVLTPLPIIPLTLIGLVAACLIGDAVWLTLSALYELLT